MSREWVFERFMVWKLELGFLKKMRYEWEREDLKGKMKYEDRLKGIRVLGSKSMNIGFE